MPTYWSPCLSALISCCLNFILCTRKTFPLTGSVLLVFICPHPFFCYYTPFLIRLSFFFYEKAQIIHKIHRVIHIYTRVICGYVDCHVVYQLCYHIECHRFECHRCCHNQASQNCSTFLATVSTVTGTTCSHSLGNILR